MSSQNQTQSGFTVQSIVFETPDFAVAYGAWKDGNICLGMRWTGKNGGVEFPKSSDNSAWFIIPDELESAFAKSLFNLPGTQRSNLLAALPDFV